MIVVMKKDWMWRNIRSSHRNTQRENINHLRRQQHSDQGEKQQVGGLIDSSKLCGGGSHETKTGMQFLQIKEPKGERCTDEYYKATVDTCFTHMGTKRGINTYGKRAGVDMSQP